MKKALDYVSDYQLKSACKDAICIAPPKVTQMIFAVLEDWYHHIVLTHSYKLVSFLKHILVNTTIFKVQCSSLLTIHKLSMRPSYIGAGDVGQKKNSQNKLTIHWIEN